MKQLHPIPGTPRGKLPFAPEGWPFIIPVALFAVTAIVMGKQIAGPLLLLLLAFVLNFFRDPERRIPEEPGVFVSPADGKVICAEVVNGVARIDIFMNVFNVHVNRAPASGRITHMQYTPGKFINASFEAASDENERNRFEMETDEGDKIVFTQISGLLARRIVSYVAVGDEVARGQRVGMIRFGSRVNCEFPAGCEILVKPGSQVSAGSTILARKPGVSA